MASHPIPYMKGQRCIYVEKQTTHDSAKEHFHLPLILICSFKNINPLVFLHIMIQTDKPSPSSHFPITSYYENKWWGSLANQNVRCLGENMLHGI